MRKTSSALIGLVVVLLSLGIVILASTSSVRGSATFGNPQYFLNKQLGWLVVALLAGLACARFDYHYWKRLAPALGILSVLLLIAVFVPGIGLRVGGSSRWIRLGPLTLQSSEVAKFSIVVGMAAWLSYVGRKVDNFMEGLFVPGLGVLLVLGLIMGETDFGTTVLIAMVCAIMFFAAGTRLSYLAPILLLGFCLGMLFLMQSELRWTRIMAFLHPNDPEYIEKAYHLAQSKIAFINGGWLGVGLGNSIQKQLYLPEAHTDFIFAIIGEELGFVVSLSVVLIYIGLLVCGMRISLKAPDLFGKLTAFGLTMMLVIQAFINIAVVTGIAPTKGIALPFISYGGSSLLMSMACVGVLLNIASHCGDRQTDRHTKPIKDKMRRF
jgi:cell division protein FtsW